MEIKERGVLFKIRGVSGAAARTSNFKRPKKKKCNSKGRGRVIKNNITQHEQQAIRDICIGMLRRSLWESFSKCKRYFTYL